MDEPQPLFCICARQLSFLIPKAELRLLEPMLPRRILLVIESFQSEVAHFKSTFPDEVASKIPDKCYCFDPHARSLDHAASVLSMGQYLSRLDNFDLCARYALDEVRE
jgi:hypothetical protein